MEQQTLASCDTNSAEKPIKTIVDLIADLEGVDPVELSPPLYSVIDPDALDSLFDSSTSDNSQTPVQVCFQYSGYEVRIQSNGEIAILNH